MSHSESTSGSRFITTGPSSSTDCQVLVDSRYAESFIRFLLSKEIKLTPPEGGVIKPVKYQLEKEGKSGVHAFYAALSPEQLMKLALEWEQLGLNAQPRRGHGH